MKKPFVFMLLLTFTIAFAQAQVKVSLNDKSGITFPRKPKITNSGNKKIFQVKKEYKYLMNAVVADMSGNPNFRIGPNELDQFYQGVIQGSLDAAKDSKLLNKKTIKTGTFEGREIVYTKDFDGMDDIEITKQIYLINKSAVILEFWNLSGRNQSTASDEFFGSFEIQ